MPDKHTVVGGCHCGNIRYQFITTIPANELALRVCDCSFCSKVGAVYASDPDGQLDIETKDHEMVKRYQFSTKVVDFIFCRKCGVMPFVLSNIEGTVYAVININTANENVALGAIRRMSFTGETIDESIRRRKQSWIADVKLDWSRMVGLEFN